MRKSIISLIYIVIFTSCAFPVLSLDLYYSDYPLIENQPCADIPIVAVSPDEKMSILGTVRICMLSRASEGIVFDRRTTVDETTMISLIDAYAFASGYAGSKGLFFISYDLHSDSVSGASTGASVATGMVSLFEESDYNAQYILTGGVDAYGNLQETGGILLKTMALAGSGKTLIVPHGQSLQQVFEKRMLDTKEILVSRYVDISMYAESKEAHLEEAENLREILPRIMQKI